MKGDVGSRRLRAGVIGVGVMGWNHARVLASLPGAELVGVADAAEEARAKTAAALGCRAFADIASLLAEDLDLAIVAVPNHLHAGVGEACFAAGAHVLVEKPIAGTVADAARLIAAAERAGRKLMVGHVERFNPAVRAAAAACRGETIRSIQLIRVGPFPPRMSEIGVVIDLGVHDIDIIRMISGADIVDVQAQIATSRGEREDTAMLQFRTANGVMAHINTNWITPFKSRRLEIATDRKFVVADLITRQVQEFFDYQADGSFRSRGVHIVMAEPLREELDSFLRCIREDTAPPVTGEDGLRNLEIALECLRVGSRPAAAEA